MVKTNKQIRWDLAQEYRAKLWDVNKALDVLTKSWYTEEELNESRKRLIENLQSELSNEDGYEKARQSHRTENESKKSLNEAKKKKIDLQREYQEKFREVNKDIIEKVKNYVDAQVSHRWEVEQEAHNDVVDNRFCRNFETVVADLITNHIKVDENVEMMWYNWKKVIVDLPAIWKFHWYSFRFFVSDDNVSFLDFGRKYFWRRSKLERKSFSSWELDDFKLALFAYIAEFFKNYSYDTKYWNNWKNWVDENDDVEQVLKKIPWLDSSYWLYNDSDHYPAAWWKVDGSFSMLFNLTKEWRRWVKLKLLLKLD